MDPQPSVLRGARHPNLSDIIPDYPSNAPVDRANIPAKADMFPWKLWQGTLTDCVDAWETYGMLALEAIFAIPSINLPTNGRDRPIGLAPNDTTSTALPNTTVVLTREIVEAALKGPNSTVYSYFIPNVMKIPQTM